MDTTLENYIENKPILRAAIIAAKMRSKHEKRIYNSTELLDDDELRAELEAEKNVLNGNKENSKVMASLDDDYLELDLDEVDHYSKCFEELNQTTKDLSISKENPTKTNKDIMENNNNINKSQPSNFEFPKRGFQQQQQKQQPEVFDLRQIVDERKQEERFNRPQWRVSPFNVDTNRSIKSNNNNFKFKPARGNAGHNRSGRNNTFNHPRNSRNSNSNGNGNLNLHPQALMLMKSLLWPNQNVAQNCACLRQNLLHFNPICNSNGINDVALNFMNGRTNPLMFGHNTCGGGGGGLTSAGAFNPIAGCNTNYCSCKNVSRLNNNNDIFNQFFSMSSCGNAAAPGYAKNNGVTPISCGNFKRQKAATQTDVNMKDLSNDNINRTTPSNDIASAIGIPLKDLEVPSVIGLLEHIFENGLTIKLFPGKNPPMDANSQSTQ